MELKPKQQGDVFLVPIGDAPAGGTPMPSEGGVFVLARGEATGHRHVVEAIAGVEFVEKDGKFYLVTLVPVPVRHEEHKPVTIPPGTWEVGGVREYDHFAEEARAVRD